MTGLAVLNNKGGVAKTITSVNLAYALATKKNQKTLIVDMDGQANATSNLGGIKEGQPTIHDVLFRNIPIKEAIHPTDYKNLYLLPSSDEFLSASAILRTEEMIPPQMYLKRAIGSALDDFHFIIYDCPPSLDVLTANVLMVTDFAIIPTLASDSSVQGITRVLDAIRKTNLIRYTELKMLGVLLTRLKSNHLVTKHNVERIKEMGVPLFDVNIRDTTRVAQSESMHMPVMAFDAKCTASMDYSSFANELLTSIAREVG